MNDKLQQALAELINKATGAAESSTSFLLAELPDVVYQLLLWHGVKNFVLFLMGIAFIAVWVYINYKQVKLIAGKYDDINDVDPIFIFNLFQVFLVFIPAVLLNLEWLQIWIAPKVWLIEYAAGLVK